VGEDALDLGENRKRLEKEKFVRGTGEVNTYVYNWKLEPLEGEDVSLISV
jgi:hypothetical protein